ncbi:MauE/DoxX family redox-associated membrane protein [Pseudomonadota bacterium]
MIDPLIVKTISVALGVLLIGAAWHKLSAVKVFAAVLEDYRLLPAFAIPVIARLLPVLEIGLGVAWISGFALSVVAPVTAALLGVFTAAIAVNILRGRVHISCGCGLGGAATENQPLSWVLVLRNLFLIAVSLLPLVTVSDRSFGMIDWLTLSLALLVSGLLYLGASQLLQNQAGIRSWRKAHD